MSEPDANSARDFSAAYRQQWHHFTQLFVRPEPANASRSPARKRDPRSLIASHAALIQGRQLQNVRVSITELREKPISYLAA
jgi:hypothetical protein